MRVKELMLYRHMEQEKILHDMAFLAENYDSDYYYREDLRGLLFDCANKILELAVSHGLEGNLWHNYLTYLLVSDENAYSTSCEIVGAAAGSINRAAMHDFAVFKELFDYDFVDMEHKLGADCMSMLREFTASGGHGRMFNKRISDRITVMRNGESKGTYNSEEVDIQRLTELIVDRQVMSSYDGIKKEPKKNDVVLKMEHLTIEGKGKPVLDDISFSVRHGEILGIAGVQGNGQSELVRAIIGMSDISNGTVTLNNQRIDCLSVKKRRELGLSYIPEDRLEVGTAGDASVSENIISSYLESKEINNGLFLDNRNVKALADELIEKYSIRTKSAYTTVKSLSGGNMQKVVVAREAQTKPDCMIAEQPTQGIDIGSSEFIRTQLIEMRNDGAGILLVSADLDEVISLSDRILVMHDGKIVAYYDSTKDISLNELGLYMLGVKEQTAEEIRGAIE